MALHLSVRQVKYHQLFEAKESYTDEYIQAIGARVGGADDHAPSRIVIANGPQYGTVSPSDVKKAAREAFNAEGIDLLAIFGFAFDRQATGLTEDDGVTNEGSANVAGVRKPGRIPVLMIRMNADLPMGVELKKTRACNFFTVFGEPDIEIRVTPDRHVADLKGVNVYDPTTGVVRSKDIGQMRFDDRH